MKLVFSGDIYGAPRSFKTSGAAVWTRPDPIQIDWEIVADGDHAIVSTGIGEFHDGPKTDQEWLGTPALWDLLLDCRHLARRAIQTVCDAIGCIRGDASVVVLTDVKLPGGTSHHLNTAVILPPAAPEEQRCVESAISGVDVRNDYFRHALADFRRAILEADDTAAFCFRAVEALRETFVDDKIKEKKQDKESWFALNKALRLEKSYLDRVRALALPQRHGDRQEYVSGNARIDLLGRTRAILFRYAVFLEKGSIDPGVYPILM
jgi:hypothetical protein